MYYKLDVKRFTRDMELVRSLGYTEETKAAWHFFRELVWTFFGSTGMEIIDWWLWVDEVGKEKILRKGDLCDWWANGPRDNKEREIEADLSTIENLFNYLIEKTARKAPETE